MRLYFFGNMYLSSIQQGIQAAHVVHELFLKYPAYDPNHHDLDETGDTLFEWADNHKTMILLNGGYSDNLRELINQFNDLRNPYPWTSFHEGQDSLDGALTCVGIVLPEKIYEAAKALREGNIAAEQIPVQESWSPEDGITWYYTKWEYELCLELNKYGMAS